MLASECEGTMLYRAMPIVANHAAASRMVRRANVCPVLSCPVLTRRGASTGTAARSALSRRCPSTSAHRARALSCSCARTNRTAEGRADGRQHGLRLGPDTHRPASCTSDVVHMHARGVFRTCARELRLRVRCKGAIVEYSQIEFAE